jgi:hypothetical protein
MDSSLLLILLHKKEEDQRKGRKEEREKQELVSILIKTDHFTEDLRPLTSKLCVPHY